MHPIERLRMVARTEGAGPGSVALEAAEILTELAGEPAVLVTACRRLLERQPEVGPLWWISSRLLASDDPVAEAGRVAEELDDDPTADVLSSLLPDNARVCVIGWPEHASHAVAGRGDLAVVVVDAGGEGTGLARMLRRGGRDVELAPDIGVAAAVATCDIVLLEAWAVGPAATLAGAGSRAAAAVAAHAGTTVWLAAGAGTVLPGEYWDLLHSGLAADPRPWDAAREPVPLDLLHQVVGPSGPRAPLEAVADHGCQVVPGLLRSPTDHQATALDPPCGLGHGRGRP